MYILTLFVWAVMVVNSVVLRKLDKMAYVHADIIRSVMFPSLLGFDNFLCIVLSGLLQM